MPVLAQPAVAAGHGGDQAAQYAAEHLHRILARSKDPTQPQALVEVSSLSVAVIAEYVTHAEHMSGRDVPTACHSSEHME